MILKFNKTPFIFRIILFSFLLPFTLTAEERKTKKINLEKLPEIPSLSSRDDIFKEYSAVLDENYKFIAQGEEDDVLLLFFKCTVPKDMNLLSLAARCNVPYETIATLNHLENGSKSLEGKTIIIPTVPGLFISEVSKDNLQVILKNRCFEILQNTDTCYNIGNENFIFLQNQRFTPTERAYFLDTNLGLPVDSELSYISSSFGPRKNPFSGIWKNHKGVDFAASEGVPVYAVKNGKVSLTVENDTTFGNYIIISHDTGNMTSVYAHLSKMSVKYGQTVKRGDVIGYVGKTGMVTGPHLHFEIRFGGVAEDPEKLLPVKSKK